MSDLAAYANIINAHTGVIFATLEFEDGVTLDEAANAAYNFINAEVSPGVECTIEIQQKPDVDPSCRGCILADLCPSQPDCVA